MKFALGERKVSLSIREFAEFRIGPGDAGLGRAGRRRAELGQAWHRELQTRAQDQYRGAEILFEAPVKGQWSCRKWRVELQGGADQGIQARDSVLLREIKTVNAVLPREEDELRRAFPGHFAQLAAYVALAPLQEAWRGLKASGELILVNINDGFTQTVRMPLDPAARGIFQAQMERLHTFIEERWQARQRLRRLRYSPPFAELRDEQKNIREAMERQTGRSPLLLFEAPTGFGKTGLALDFALGLLRDGVCHRAVYLTGKSTGQLQVLEQLRQMLLPEGGFRYFQMRNKAEHAIESALHTCGGRGNCRMSAAERWEQSGLDPAALFHEGTAGIETIRELGRRTGVCPYEISRAALPFADLWVGDYNYVFGPRTSGVFDNQPDYDPGQSVLIVDEAHNLPARAAGAWSRRGSAEEAWRVHEEMDFANVPAQLLAVWEKWARFLETLRPVERLDLSGEYELRDLLDAVSEEIRRSPLDPAPFTEEAYDRLWDCLDWRAALDHPGLERLLWVPAAGELRLDCLSAAPEIAAGLKRFSHAVLMSATLSPVNLYLEACGLSAAECGHLSAAARWRAKAYDLAIDTRGDTRLRKRGQYYRLTAETVSLLCAGAAEPVAVFFPSYRYAEAVSRAAGEIDPFLRVSIQPRGLSLPEQESFLEEAMLVSHALFLVLGGSFSESIDLLGGRIRRAMVAGPALPEVNPLQQARMEERGHLSKQEAFRQVYLVPGMIKINQALGRLARAPDHKAKVLLHCRRFAEPACRGLLDPDFQVRRIISTPDGLLHWLNEREDG